MKKFKELCWMLAVAIICLSLIAYTLHAFEVL